MNPSLYGEVYARTYDFLYEDKDYDAECELITRLLRQHRPESSNSILDLGCGTGEHLVRLARQGCHVVGVDQSAAMLAQARAKLAHRGLTGIRLVEGDVRRVHLDELFDAAILMFAVLGYQLSNADVLATLHTIRQHLKPGGLLIGDFWYGPAVLHQRPAERHRLVPTENGQILRLASGHLDVRRHVCTVIHDVWVFEGHQVTAQTHEAHDLRFFFPLEMEFFFQQAGLALIRLGAFPDFERDPDESTWRVLAVGQAV